MDATFETRLHAHHEALFRAALKLCHGDLALAEDMVQDTYVKAIRHADRFEDGTNLKAWLMRILANSVISFFRHRQVAKENPYPEGFDPAGELPVDLEVSDEVADAIKDLPEDYRKVFLMAALEESPYQKIAEKLKIPVGTVMSRLWRARQTLQARLAPAMN
jgi:RNA polymerase sigma-70 factor (ECF subfamily)